MPRTTVIVVYPGFQALDLVGPHEVLAAAGVEVAIAACAPGAVASESGLAIQAEVALGSLAPRELDTVIVVGGDGIDAACADPALTDWLRATGAGARRVASVCTGAFLLAAAGLLDGRRATTHWAHAATLAARHPAVRVEPDRIHVRDGHVWTSAGVTAGIDLALALVEEDAGAELAQDIARRLVLALRRTGGQSQYATAVWRDPVSPGPVRVALDRIHAAPGADLGVAALARHAHLSERHFQRLFTAQVGIPPRRYVERARVEAARRQLEATPDGIEAIARDAGFGTAESMRRAFDRELGVTPSEYRARFALAPAPTRGAT